MLELGGRGMDRGGGSDICDIRGVIPRSQSRGFLFVHFRAYNQGACAGTGVEEPRMYFKQAQSLDTDMSCCIYTYVSIKNCPLNYVALV